MYETGRDCMGPDIFKSFTICASLLVNARHVCTDREVPGLKLRRHEVDQLRLVPRDVADKSLIGRIGLDFGFGIGGARRQPEGPDTVTSFTLPSHRAIFAIDVDELGLAGNASVPRQYLKAISISARQSGPCATGPTRQRSPGAERRN